MEFTNHVLNNRLIEYFKLLDEVLKYNLYYFLIFFLNKNFLSLKLV
jgi:hypothetical protein